MPTSTTAECKEKGSAKVTDVKENTEEEEELGIRYTIFP